jgi:hypothetical protein
MNLPGTSEFFRPTGAVSVPAEPAAAPVPEAPAEPPTHGTPPEPEVRRDGVPARGATPRPSGRKRHDEKITVYISAAELVALEQTRLSLRVEHGLVSDRGRIVREAVAVLLEDYERNGTASMLVRRLADG